MRPTEAFNTDNDAESDAPLLDAAQLDGLIAVAGVDGTREILGAFWRSSDSLIATLKDQLQKAAAADAGRTAHALKGSALNVGAVRFSGSIRRIEECCRNLAPSAALLLVSVAERQYRETVTAFEAHLKAGER